jgi:ABC-2 type transport system ATP-binding protein
MNSEHVIEVREVTKKYGTVVAVDALSFEVQRGEIFAFLGPTALARRP